MDGELYALALLRLSAGSVALNILVAVALMGAGVAMMLLEYTRGRGLTPSRTAIPLWMTYLALIVLGLYLIISAILDG